MNCPLCRGQTIVVDSRLRDDCITRRRECLVCEYRFSTIEVEREHYKRMVPPDREALRASVDRFLLNLKAAIYKALKL